MSERNHAAVSTGANQPSRMKPFWMVTGTAAVLVAGGIGVQMWRAQSSSAAEEPGKVSVNKAQPAAGALANPQKESAAKVTRNGRAIKIPLDDVAKECLSRVGNDVLESMINRAVIQLACEEAGVAITDAEVDQEIIRIAKQFNIPTETWIQMLQSERNITPEQYKRDVIWPMLALKKLTGEKVEVSDEDMHKAFVRQFGPRVKCRMIMVDNVRRANEVWQKATANKEDFNRLAKEASIEPNSKAMEGLVPPIARYAGNPELEEAAFKLKVGEISGIISVGSNRYVILKCEGFTEQKVQDPNEVRDILYKDLVDEKVQVSVAKMFDDLKKSSRVDNYWNNTTTGDVKQVSGTQTPGAARAAQPAGGTKAPTGSPAAGVKSPLTSPKSATSPVKRQ